MYMTNPSRPAESASGKFYLEPALGNTVLPQYLEPKLAGTAMADAVSTYGFPIVTLAGGAALIATTKKKSIKLVGAAFIALSAISAIKEARARGVF